MIIQSATSAEVFTDGSCHTQHCIGAWASIILIGREKIVLSDVCSNTTHNRMELLAVIKALECIKQQHSFVTRIHLVSDSQYVIGLIDRQPKFIKANFKTKAGNDIRNIDLVKELLAFTTQLHIQFIKIKAHQKQTSVVNYNIEVDKICRRLVRETVLKQNPISDESYK